MTTSFDSFSSSSFPMAWSPPSSGTSWSGQGATAFEPERASTGTNLLAQLGLVPSQALPASATHSSSMQTQTLLSTTVAPQRHAEQMNLGCIEPTVQAQSPFSFSPPNQANQRYQAFSPARNDQASEIEWASATPGSMAKQFRFNPNAMPFVFQHSPNGAVDTFSDCADSEGAGTTTTVSRGARLSSDDGEELGVVDAEAVSAAVASAVISSPASGPVLPPPGIQFMADSTASSKQSQAPPRLVLPVAKNKDQAGSLWCTEPPRAADTDTLFWPPPVALPPPQPSQETANGYSSPATSPTSRAEAMSPLLMQLRGTAHSVALGALPSPDLGPSFSPRDSSIWNDFSLSAAAV